MLPLILYMGYRFFDQYSLLHFATGVIAYFWGLSLETFFLIHFLFEILENTQTGMTVINLFPFWPGGKDYADSFINITGDNVFAVIGWVTAYYLSNYGQEHNWVK